MEKLQSAIEKARQSRSGAPAPAEKAPRKLPAATGIDARWQALPEHIFDPELLQKNRIVTLRASSEATPFDILRTKIVLQMKQNGWKRLAITSPTPECGKTTTACNLAIGLGRQADMRSILFDLDLHRPGIAKYLGITSGDSIQRLLEKRATMEEVAVRHGENLAIASAQRSTADPTRLLMSRGVSEIIDSIQADYDPDVMIFDLPPLLANDSTRSFLRNVDCALIIAQAGVSTVAQIDNCEREVAENTNVLGVALNQCTYIEDGQKYEYY